jgi:hypothetical protein
MILVSLGGFVGSICSCSSWEVVGVCTIVLVPHARDTIIKTAIAMKMWSKRLFLVYIAFSFYCLEPPESILNWGKRIYQPEDDLVSITFLHIQACPPPKLSILNFQSLILTYSIYLSYPSQQYLV